MVNVSRRWIVPIVVAGAFLQAAAADLTVYNLPADSMTLGCYKVTVNGTPVPVLRAVQNDFRVNDSDWDLDYGDYGFAAFDCDGPVEVRVKSNLALDQAVLRPLSKRIRVDFPRPNEAVFTLTKPGQFSLEPFGPVSPLLIFFNPPETDVPQTTDPGVVYFGSGLHRPKGGLIHLSDNQTLYLDGGAIVEAGLRIEGTNITVRGRGILDGTPWPWRKGPVVFRNKKDQKGRIIERGHMNQVRDSRNVRFEGITVRGAWQWSFYLQNSDNVTFENVKIVGGKNHNDDGIDPVNSRGVTVRNCFIRTADDCFALKGHCRDDGPVEDIQIENCVLWTETQRIALLGHESRAPVMRNIVFRDIDVIHMGPNIGIALQPGEEMLLEQVLFENVRINSDGYVGVINPVRIIDVSPTVNKFMQDKVPGYVRDVTFKDVTVTGSEKRKKMIRVVGYDEQHSAEDIKFIHVTVYGNEARTGSDFVNIGNYSRKVKFE